MDDIRCELGKRDEDKAPFLKFGVGNRQLGKSYCQIVVDEYIEVYQPGTVADRRGAAHLALDGFKQPEESARLQQSLSFQNLIEKARLG